MTLKKIIFLFSLVLNGYISHSQDVKISGTIKDTSSFANVKNSVVALLTPKDSILQSFTRVNANGSFTLNKVKPGNYIMLITHPLFADYVEDIAINAASTELPLIALTPKSKLLEAVILKSGSPIRIKGDTTVYTADSFKVSANANVEELLKKLPGIQVDKNGEIKAMGEKVEKVLVDGEEFFGDDPGMAVKNLRADAVKEVQVFKKKSDQAEFTGIDDGQEKQTINLKLKEDKKKGYFGKIDVAGGPLKNKDPRFNSNMMFSSFKGKRKISAFLLNGNTGQDGLSWQDREKFASDDINMMMMDDGGGMSFWGGGGQGDDEPYVSTQNGFITNVNAGLQYNNKFANNKHTLNFSPKFNSQVYDNNKSNYSRTDLGDSALIENSATKTHVNRYNFMNKGSYDMKLDSAGNSSLKVTVGANIYHTESSEMVNSNTIGETGTKKNSSASDRSTNSDKQAYTVTAFFRHKFKKNRRTISVNTDFYTLNSNADNYLDREYEAFYNGVSLGMQDINQFTNSDKSTKRFNTRMVYTEPMSKKTALEFAHEININNGTNIQKTYSFDPSSGKYETIVDSLSNDFKQTIVENKPSVKFSYNGKKITYSFGSGVGFTSFNLNDRTLDKNYNRHYTNFFPSANFNYKFKSNNNFRFNYNGRTTQPSINQLQPLRNNNNQFNQYVGNPDLKPSFNHNFGLGVNSYNFLKDSWKYLGLWGSVTQNSITNDRQINPQTGYTITKPVNTNGNWSVGVYTGIGLKLKKADIRLNLSPNMNYSKYADIINSQVSFSKTFSGGLGLDLQKSKENKYEFSLGNNYSMSSNTNSQRNTKNKFSSYTLDFNGTIYYKREWSIQSDYNFYYRGKVTESGGALNNNMWNAKLQRTLKNKEFTIYLQVRDILNQNIGFDRNFNGNNYYEERNDRLKRYFMIGFRWDFKNKGPKPKEEPASNNIIALPK
ncbi:MAG: TonB-dependent receptor [Chitinophagaceae bacterium]|nr:TonB-dependent receptor [Chitinophagaceae bacterium]